MHSTLKLNAVNKSSQHLYDLNIKKAEIWWSL